MKTKELDGVKRNTLVVLLSDGSIHKVVQIDGHIRPFCLDTGGRVTRQEIQPLDCSNKKDT